MATPKKSLGRGLGTLISGGAKNPSPAPTGKPEPAKPVTQTAVTPTKTAEPPPSLPYQEISVTKIVPGKWQPRRAFSEHSIKELADSIQSEGLLQPIVVRKTKEGYELIAGERRWRAFQKLNLKTIPARLVDASDAATAAMTLIENLQREGLSPIEEALGFASLMRDFNLTQEAVAERVGKPRATVANSVRLLSLNREIQGYLASGFLTTGHAKVILGLETEAVQTLAARRVIEQGASVRETENIVQKLKSAKPDARATAKQSDTRKAAELMAALADIEKRLTSRFNTKVHLKHGAKHGKIVIEYYGNDDLKRILEQIGAK